MKKWLEQLKERPNLFLALLLAGWWILNLAQAAFTGLSGDELYYWYISQRLDWGYFDHPPMFALLTRFGVSLGGDGALWIRLGALTLQPLYLYLFWTLARTPQSTWRSAGRYFLIAFSIPLLQLYGFVDTPDAPLMFFSALFLWSYRHYLKTPRERGLLNRDLWLYSLALCVALAGLAYSKYHGALVFLLIVLSNLNLLTKRSFWLLAFGAALLVLPHLQWQYEHDWVSLRYHTSGRNALFEWGNVWEFLLNLWVTFNPLLLPLFLLVLVKFKAADRFERGLKFLAWGFILFFGFSALRGQVQPQWLIPVVFPLLYWLFREGERRPKLRRVIRRVGWVSVLLFVAVRIFAMCYHGTAIRNEIFTNERDTKALGQQLGNMPIICDGNYRMASSYIYYNHAEAYAMPSIYTRSSQFELLDTDTRLYGKQVAIGISPKVMDSIPPALRKERFPVYFQATPRSGVFHYRVVDHYIPTRRVEITHSPLPEKILTGEVLPMTLTLYNPYPFDIPMEGIRLVAQFRPWRLEHYDVPVKTAPQISELKAGERVTVRVYLTIPQLKESRDYGFGFTLQRWPFGSWYNSPRSTIYVVNPHGRIN